MKMKRPHISELTLEEKIGQLLMAAQYPLLIKTVDGKDVPREREVTRRFDRKIAGRAVTLVREIG